MNLSTDRAAGIRLPDRCQSSAARAGQNWTYGDAETGHLTKAPGVVSMSRAGLTRVRQPAGHGCQKGAEAGLNIQAGAMNSGWRLNSALAGAVNLTLDTGVQGRKNGGAKAATHYKRRPVKAGE